MRFDAWLVGTLAHYLDGEIAHQCPVLLGKEESRCHGVHSQALSEFNRQLPGHVLREIVDSGFRASIANHTSQWA